MSVLGLLGWLSNLGWLNGIDRDPDPAKGLQQLVTEMDAAVQLAGDPESYAPRREGIHVGSAGSENSAFTLRAWDSSLEHPVSGVRIINNRTSENLAITDREGRASFTPALLEDGLELTAEGYVTVVVQEGAWRRAPAEGSPRSRRIVLYPEGELVVLIEDAEGVPLEGVEVWIGAEPHKPRDNSLDVAMSMLEREAYPRETNRYRVAAASFLGRTEAFGSVRAQSVPCGAPLFVVARSDSVLERRLLTVDGTIRRLRLVIATEATAVLGGQVTWDDGTPVKSGRLRLFDGKGVEETMLTPRGRYVFSRVRSQHVWLEVLTPIPKGVYLDMATVGETAPDIVLPRPVRVAGRLLTDTESYEDWRAECWQDDRQVGHQRIASDGSFEFVVPRGPCTLLFCCSGSWPEPILASADIVAPADDLLIDARGRVGSARLRVPSVAEGTKVLVHEFRAQPGSAERQLGDPTRWKSRSAHVLRDGLIELSVLPPGSVRWLIDAGPRGTAWTDSIEVTSGARLEVGPLEVGFGTLLRPTRTVGNSPSPTLVLGSAKLADRHLSGGMEANPWAERLPAGPWYLLPLGAGASLDAAVWLDVQPGDFLELQEAFEALSKVQGRVTSKEQGVAGRWVRLVSESPIGRIDRFEGGGRTITNKEGCFQFDQVVPGECYLTIQDGPRFLEVVERLSISPGQATEVLIDLGDEDSHATVRFRHGNQPVPGIETVKVLPSTGSRALAARPEGGEAWAIRGVCGRALFILTTAPTKRQGNEFGETVLVGEGDLVEGTDIVELFDNSLRVVMTGSAIMPPIAFLEEWDGVDCRVTCIGTSPALVRMKVDTDSYEFLCVPYRSKIRLWGRDGNGAVVERVVEMNGSKGASVYWP